MTCAIMLGSAIVRGHTLGGVSAATILRGVPGSSFTHFVVTMRKTK